MFNEMNDKEIQIATKLINHGLERAAGALGQVLNSPIDIKAVDFTIVHVQNVPQFSSKTGNDVHVLNTRLMGELNGICHLVLSEEEVSKVHKACLPEDIIKSEVEEHKTLRRELLTEIDNIVAAAAITEFSNYLDLKMFGGVPKLITMDADALNSYIAEEAINLHSLIQFKAYIHGPELDIIPDFVWLIEDKFIENIRSFAENADTLQLEKLLSK